MLPFIAKSRTYDFMLQCGDKLFQGFFCFNNST